MKIARFTYQNQVHYGQLSADGQMLALIEGDLWNAYSVTATQVPLAEVKLLPPVAPRKLICVGLNYASHAKESNIPKIPEQPLIFMVSPAATIGDGQAIKLDNLQDRIDYEAEIAVVIGQEAKDVAAANANEVIFGFTCANDVSNRHLQKRDGQFTRAKSFDTYKPLGPWIETELDLSAEQIQLWQNGELKQSAPLTDMIFSIPEIVSFISSIMTLEPGDVILTGTPAGVGKLVPEDKLVIEIPGIGRLTNNVIE